MSGEKEFILAGSLSKKLGKRELEKSEEYSNDFCTDIVRKLNEQKEMKSQGGRKIKDSKFMKIVDDFFEGNEEIQKSKFMNYLLENTRRNEKMLTLEEHVSILEQLTIELKNNEDNMNNVLKEHSENERRMNRMIIDLENENFILTEKLVKLSEKLRTIRDQNSKLNITVQNRNKNIKKWKNLFLFSTFFFASTSIAIYLNKI